MASARRPEKQGPPEFFYNDDEAKKYTNNSRIIEIQGRMSERAIELLNLPEGECAFILDIGCGSGLSGQVVEEEGHCFIGMDISQSMLNVAIDKKSTGDCHGDFLLGDMGEGVPFRAGAFDGAISISALQWLCNADKKVHHPASRLYKLFSTLYASLSRGSRAVFQFYPENSHQIDLITQQAMKAGFTGGVVVDYPNSTKAKKMFLCLFTGGENVTLPKGLTGHEDMDIEEEHVKYNGSMNVREKRKMKGNKLPKHSKEWIQQKKERRRRQGKDTRHDSKYTGRKRKDRF